MIDSADGIFERMDGRHIRRLATLDHQHCDAEQPCRLQLGIGRIATTVLGDDDLDLMLLHQSQFVRQRKRPLGQHGEKLRQGERRLDGIDAAHEIEMLGQGFRMVCLLAADCQEDTRGLRRQRGESRGDIRHALPTITLDGFPAFSAQDKDGNAGLAGRHDSVARNALGKGMRGIDHEIDPVINQKSRQSVAAAKAADADSNILSGRLLRTAGQRYQHVEIGAARKHLRKLTRLGRAAKDENAGSAHV